MRLFVPLAAAFCLIVSLAACERESPEPPAGGPEAAAALSPGDAAPAAGTADCSMTMGWDPWPPYHYENPQGMIEGLDVELMRAIMADLGCELDFRRDSWGTLLGDIEAGEIDLITGATVTGERQSYAWFSDPFRTEDFALYVRQDEAGRWEGDSLAALMAQGMRLGVTDAYVYGDTVQAVLDDPAYADQVIHAGFGEANAGRLLDGVIDAFIEDVYVAAALRRRLGLEEAIVPHPLELESGGEVRIMFSKESVEPERVARVNGSLAALRESGDYEAIRSRYLE